ncbi:MAG: hypothetical protein M1113_04730 [Candidatus Thermoplasmatota archaeon]|nr:hypothetical protein [Candidatus Thermoplasmatota archaeon]
MERKHNRGIGMSHKPILSRIREPTNLESNKAYLTNSEAVKWFFFVVFLALRTRFRILKVLKDHNLPGNMSVNEIIFELSKMERIVEKSGTEYFAAVPKKKG